MKPPFEETEPFASAAVSDKPPFEETEPVDDNRESWSDAVTTAGKRLISLPVTVAKTMTTPEGQTKLFKKGGWAVPLVGGLAFGPIGAAGGEFARQLGAAAVDPSQVPETALGRFGRVMGQGAAFVNPSQVIAEVPGAATAARYLSGKVAGAADAVGDVARSAGRRALGFTKRFLNKPGNLKRSNEVTQTMLDEGVIRNPIFHPFTSGTEATEARIGQLMEKSGQQMGYTRQVLDANGIPGPNMENSAKTVLQQLNPRFADERRIADEIVEDIKALGAGDLSYDDAFTVLKKLDQKARYSPMGGPTDQLKANMYRRAYGIFRNELDSAIDRGSMVLGDFAGTTLKNYAKAKKFFGRASDAEKAVTNKLSSEAGNNRIGLREAAVAAAELASGNPVGAAAAIGAIEGVKRFGNAGLATTANAVAKGIRSSPALLAKPGLVPATLETTGQAASAITSPAVPALGGGMAAANVLTEGKAREYLKKAKGDKDLARRLAAADGWIF